ncbi:MAG: ABC transporter permease [Alphaproteobacteria bacterium]|nr:ABC transporter permease [Alphaproteobacteria bacterium]
MRLALSALAVFVVLLGAWWALSASLGLPAYILPSPLQTAAAFAARPAFILENAAVTALEMALGFACGAILGILCALAMAAALPVRMVLRPVLVASQAIPVFALAPIFVVWMGYGMAPKIAIATLVIFFPVAAAFADGLRRTPPALAEAARVMAGTGLAARWRVLRHVTVPAALPALGTGLRVGAGVAAIAAVIGEWAGSSAGLGYVMLWANGRSQIALMFAALITLFALAIAFAALIDVLTRRMTPWIAETP